ncbi:CENP-B N-terminal DNA-binding domain [Popillia japonica]|uniref:CENP-B N-terminal DNA-binding domain n=1 Tax=Popillia japonica TaxID=7064 RepID=A0AAW1N145_POPJA
MPRQYKRTSLQQSRDTGAMQSAIKAVIEDNVPLQTASIIYNVPRNTLKRRVLGKSIFATGGKKILGSIRPVFDQKQEQEIVEHIKEMETRFYGLSKKDVRSLAFNKSKSRKLLNILRRWRLDSMGFPRKMNILRRWRLDSMGFPRKM